MLRRQLCLHGALLAVVLAACAVRQHITNPQACSMLTGVAAGAMLQDCLGQLADGAQLDLPPGRLVITQPLVLEHRVTITTAGVPSDAPRCAEDGAGCAVLALRLAKPGGPGQAAISVQGAGTVLNHLVIEGARTDTTRNDLAACRGGARPSMGGLEVAAARVSISNSVLRDVACYSAVVVNPRVDGFRFTGNAVLSNGTHDHRAMWADGLTLLDGVNDVVRDNLFRDNTDVQLVLGGCRHCTITGNRIETSEAPDRAAFAGLLVHGWPNTSGDYAGTTITGNTIDCGPARGCGFGLGVGGRAWYRSSTSGGLIADNTVKRAQIGINVDEATGPVTMRDNHVTGSGGQVQSHCGTWLAGPVNIAPASRPFVDRTAGVAVPMSDVTALSFAGCLPGT